MDTDCWISTDGKQLEEPIRAYGSTGSNLSPGPKIREQEDLDIQLHDFKVSSVTIVSYMSTELTAA